jgi:hypothetical protein
VLVFVAQTCNAFSLPGVIPKSFTKGETLDFFVGPLTSKHGGLEHSFYDLPWCPGKEGATGSYYGTPFKYEFGINKPGTETCKKTWTKEEVDKFIFFSKKEYEYRVYIDDLPSATVTRDRMSE